MRIEWLGHSCFALTTASGAVVVTDPFDESVGYPAPERRADLVAMSHDHFDHNHVGKLTGPCEVIRTPGAHEAYGVRVTGIESFHDAEAGAKRGKNLIFVVEADGLRVAHMGDLGHPLRDTQIAAIGQLDALMIPVGGHFTIDATQAADIVEALRPRVAIAMHYKTDRLDFPIATAAPFLERTGGKHLERNYIDIPADLGGLPPAVALAYCG